MALKAGENRDDWYRRATWTVGDREAFLARLARSRSARSKAQYLKIQALTLLDTGRADLVRHALELADLGVKEYPDDFHLGSLHQLRARCYVRLRLPADAYDAFQESFRAAALIPTLHTNVELDFAWWVAVERLPGFHQEAVDRLNASSVAEGAFFPAIAYKLFGALALIADDGGDPSNARRWAEQAIVAVEKQESPLPRHRLLGLVRNPEADVLARLRRLATS
jgi:hypothetical protein